tara:strand:+ start:4026 stop:4616 length:591 start_codon:yes stop_codon:yes gene_type:complete
MKKSNQNFIIDTLAIITFIFLTSTGILMRFMLPPGSGKHTTIWNLDRHEWGAIHFWLSVAFFSILAFHLIYHWRWIVKMASGKPRDYSGNRIILGVIGFITVVLFAIAPLVTPVETEAKSEEYSSNSSQENESKTIRGSMTLIEVEKATGVPATYIIKSMNLPNTVSLNEKLSDLKNTYDFEMSVVRDLVDEYEKP